MSDIVRFEYNKQGLSEFVQDDLELMTKNRIRRLSDWMKMTDAKKDKYPDGLALTLDEIINGMTLSRDSITSMCATSPIVPSINKYTPDSLLSDIIKVEFEKQKKSPDFIEKQLNVLRDLGLDTLREWMVLTGTEKQEFPLPIRVILRKISGMLTLLLESSTFLPCSLMTSIHTFFHCCI